MMYLIWALPFISLVSLSYGEPINNLMLMHALPNQGPCKCEGSKETLLFSDEPPKCMNGHVPLGLLHAKYFSALSRCDTSASPYSKLSQLKLPTYAQIEHDQCGTEMVTAGYYSCVDCVKHHAAGGGCYYQLHASFAGLLNVRLNVTKLGSGDGSEATISVYEGTSGRNILMDTIHDTASKVYTPTGMNMLIELRLLKEPTEEIQFSFDFSTLGKTPANTAGCGGVLMDSGFVSNPGYPTTTYADDTCVWIFHASHGRVPLLQVRKMELVDGNSVVGNVEIREGSTGMGTLLATLSGSSEVDYRVKTPTVFLRYTSFHTSPNKGFAIFLTSQI